MSFRAQHEHIFVVRYFTTISTENIWRRAMNWKATGSGNGLMEGYPGIGQKRLQKTMRKPKAHSRYSGRDSNRAPPERKSRALPLDHPVLGQQTLFHEFLYILLRLVTGQCSHQVNVQVLAQVYSSLNTWFIQKKLIFTALTCRCL